MNTEQDKIRHYTISFKCGRYGSFVGAVLIVLIGLVKELVWDKLLDKGTFDWADMEANCIGAWEGMVLKNNRFEK